MCSCVSSFYHNSNEFQMEGRGGILPPTTSKRTPKKIRQLKLIVSWVLVRLAPLFMKQVEYVLKNPFTKDPFIKLSHPNLLAVLRKLSNKWSKFFQYFLARNQFLLHHKTMKSFRYGLIRTTGFRTATTNPQFNDSGNTKQTRSLFYVPYPIATTNTSNIIRATWPASCEQEI